MAKRPARMAIDTLGRPRPRKTLYTGADSWGFVNVVAI